MSSEEEKVIARVFPSRTNATPDDDLAFTDGPPFWEVPCDEVHVSCACTWDKGRAGFLVRMWETAGYEVKIGGPAHDDPGGEFVPGRYVEPGMIITSRGCNNACWFCSVPKREGEIRELEIKDGYDLLDNNLLQCSEGHIRGVFEMLGRQDRRDKHSKRLGIKLTGGLEALLLKDWHVDLIAGLKPKPEVLYFAYDTPDDLEPLIRAAKKMQEIGFNNQRVGCYVLMGWRQDTIEKARARLQRCVDLDMMPFAMLYANETQNADPEWTTLRRNYDRPQITRGLHKGQFGRGLSTKC